MNRFRRLWVRNLISFLKAEANVFLKRTSAVLQPNGYILWMLSIVDPVVFFCGEWMKQPLGNADFITLTLNNLWPIMLGPRSAINITLTWFWSRLVNQRPEVAHSSSVELLPHSPVWELISEEEWVEKTQRRNGVKD